MPRARDRFGRCAQALRWMEHNWPTGRPIELVWVDKIADDDGADDPDAAAQTYRSGARIVIEMRIVRCWHCLISTLRHEFAHAHLWGHARAEHRVEHHPPHFHTLVGEIEDRWNEIGWEEANEYEVD